jgi:P pilus assembly chaperone PapD
MRHLIIFFVALIFAALSFAAYSRAFNALRVDEGRTRLRLVNKQAEIALALDNPTRRAGARRGAYTAGQASGLMC